MTKKLVDFKKTSDENLLKLWVAHYKKYAEDSERKLFDKSEIQEIYDEGYKRGLADTLMQLYNAIYAVHITARTDLNNGITRLWTHINLYGDEYKRLEQIAEMYSRSDLKPDTDGAKAYREKVALYLLNDPPLKQNDTDEYTVGEQIIENTVKGLKSSILFCQKAQELVGLDIMSDGAKEQIKSTRQIIKGLLGEIANHIGYLQYTLGLMKDEEGNTTKPNKDFYKLIDNNIGVDKLAKRMAKLEEIIDRQIYNKELMEKLEKRSGEGLKALKEVEEKYPIESFGLTKGELDGVDKDIKRLSKLSRMI